MDWWGGAKRSLGGILRCLPGSRSFYNRIIRTLDGSLHYRPAAIALGPGGVAEGHGIGIIAQSPQADDREVLGLAGHTGENDLLVFGELLEALRERDSEKAYTVSVALLERNMEIYKKYFKAN